ncbi:short chain dehydrogenase reductase family protein [Stylonychia lemnae]|uniref:Short chain dehydrogenase reductase family protein n=1 Tax=Stylonychia lemnae TaxID=5949 RepID=A0A078B7E8_STYLE|nr:short chain dehydrogenase reductase family protein [Stylonychia lemnae]|eukprot:CDW90339.1 short chain dehydrogenase reductase family protein [Stylonychia lemnae]
MPILTFFENAYTLGKTAYYLFQSAEIILKMNKYVVMGFTLYGVWRVFKNFIYFPLKEVFLFLYQNTRPLSNLIYTYGEGKIIITGATRGLGPAYCESLIKAGFRDFLLIDYDYKDLQSLQTQLQEYQLKLIEIKKKQKQNIQTKNEKLLIELFGFNFNQEDNSEQIRELGAIINRQDNNDNKQKNISILINNNNKIMKTPFQQSGDKGINKLINNNIKSVTSILNLVLEQMIKQKSKCAIVNVSSATAAAEISSIEKFTINDYQVYQASLAYQCSLMNLLQSQYKEIDFLNDMPYTFDISDKNIKDLGMKVLPEAHVELVLKSLGKQQICNGTLRHRFWLYMMKNYNFPFQPALR